MSARAWLELALGRLVRFMDAYEWRIVGVAAAFAVAGPLVFWALHARYWPLGLACDVFGFGPLWLVLTRSICRSLRMRRVLRLRLAELEAAERSLDAALVRLLRSARKGPPS